MKKAVSNELKTGVLVLICLGILATLMIKVGNFSFFEKGYTVKTRFQSTAGIKEHSSVCLAGMNVGEVKKIEMIYGEETLVEATLWLREGVQVKTDAVAYITTLGLMGEKYVEIKTAKSTAAYAKEGDMINSEETLSMDDMMKMAVKVGGDISKMSTEISKTANDFSQTAKDVSKFVNNLDGTVTENKTTLNNMFKNFEKTSENFKAFSQDVKYHPWKVLAKGQEKSKAEMDALDNKMTQAQSVSNVESSASKNNFSKKR